MLRNKATLPVLQKTYDECYLTCSTAVYYEGQGNEDESMRCWKSALDQIHDHNANKVPSNYVPRTETERALMESLRQLEIQCKERIDLLEALRLSRQDDVAQPIESPSASSRINTPFDLTESELREKGWIGEGTIPAITYPELSRPALPPRPSFPTRSSSEQAVVGGSRGSSFDIGSPSSSRTRLGPLGAGPSGEKPSRSSSPEKRTMRTTLRPGKSGDRSHKPIRRATPKAVDGPGASKAASLAWNSINLRERLSRGHNSESTVSTTNIGVSETGEMEQRGALGTPRPQWDSHSRRLVNSRDTDVTETRHSFDSSQFSRGPDDSMYQRPSAISISAAANALTSSESERIPRHRTAPPPDGRSRTSKQDDLYGLQGCDDKPLMDRRNSREFPIRRKPVNQQISSSPVSDIHRKGHLHLRRTASVSSVEDSDRGTAATRSRRKVRAENKEQSLLADSRVQSGDDSSADDDKSPAALWKQKKAATLRNLPPGVDKGAAKQILNEIVVQGDEVHWDDVAGLQIAKNALREAVVYPFLRPDLFKGLREPARGMLLFGPPGTGKTMLARAVATESKSTFFSISASSLTSKYLGESEKLVRALFGLAKVLAPSIIFVDEIDSLLSQRSGSGEHEATRRIKTEFLIQWSDLQRAAAGREVSDKDRGDANRVLVLAATNLPWAIDEAARRRFVRRQYIPLPEPETRSTQIKTLVGQQKHSLTDADIEKLVELTDGFSGSDITALAKDAAMGPLRSLGEALLHMTMDEIRPIELSDFIASLTTIRPSVSKAGLKEYEDWAKEFGERGG